MKKNILISIHDVMPTNINTIKDILYDLKNNYNINKTTLLVVPGLNWKKDTLSQLNEFTKQGHELAGHGWVHKTTHYRTFYHYCHSYLISRDVAEHLSLTKQEGLTLINNCYNWFKTVHLPLPTLYVPPAWAIGKIKPKDIKHTPFKHIETLTGIITNNTLKKYPLLGYETDTYYRKKIVHISNIINKAIATFNKKPLRLSIHPNDFHLLLNQELSKDLRQNATFWTYQEFFNQQNY